MAEKSEREALYELLRDGWRTPEDKLAEAMQLIDAFGLAVHVQACEKLGDLMTVASKCGRGSWYCDIARGFGPDRDQGAAQPTTEGAKQT